MCNPGWLAERAIAALKIPKREFDMYLAMLEEAKN